MGTLPQVVIGRLAGAFRHPGALLRLRTPKACLRVSQGLECPTNDLGLPHPFSTLNAPPLRVGAPGRVGLSRLPSAQAHTEVPLYQGVSFCDAVRRAGEGEFLRVLPGSIQVCRWSPTVLGMKAPQSRFERSLAPRLPFPLVGLLLGPLQEFPGQAEVVIVRDNLEILQALLAVVEPHCLWDGHRGRLDRSALPVLVQGGQPWRRMWIRGVNRVLAPLSRRARWQAFTRWLFRSGLVTAGFDVIISHALADMSVCRNATTVPLLTGRVNVSFFCTGGITWGRNQPDHLVSGWPRPVYLRALQAVEGR